MTGQGCCCIPGCRNPGSRLNFDLRVPVVVGGRPGEAEVEVRSLLVGVCLPDLPVLEALQRSLTAVGAVAWRAELPEGEPRGPVAG